VPRAGTRGEKIEKLNPSKGDWATGYVSRSVMVPGCDFLAHRVADCELEDEAGEEGGGGREGRGKSSSIATPVA